MNNKLQLIAVGDISLQTKNTKHPFENVKDIFKDKDILFGNLETVLSEKGKKKEKAVILHSPPERVTYLKEAGFDILNIANNHIMDLGPEGFTETLEVLNQNGLTFIGVGSQKFRQSSAIVERRDIKFGFLGYYECGFKDPKDGVFINRINEDEIIRDIEKLRPQCDAIIVSLHWGIEKVFYPSPQQIEIAHKLIDSGTTVILGHHLHVIQGIEKYKHGLIAYSLGNFQFNPEISYTKTNKSMMLCLEFSKRGLENCHIIPIVIDQDFVPKVCNQTKEQMLSFVDKISEPISHGALTWRWWFEEIAAEYLSGNMRSCIIRIKRYGIKHLLQCIKWLISPFVIRCYMGLLSRRLKGR